MYINEHAFWNICIMIRAACRQEQQCCRQKPGSRSDSKTINCESHFLSHVVLQSFRYVSHLLFHLACFLTLHHIFACSWVTRGTSPWMHTALLLLHACVTVGLMSTTGHAVQHCQNAQTCTAQYDHRLTSCFVCFYLMTQAKCHI